jgi:hypothetical protein
MLNKKPYCIAIYAIIGAEGSKALPFNLWSLDVSPLLDVYKGRLETR